MKKILFTLFIIYGFSLHAQRTDYDWKKMDPKQRKEIINNLSPEERKELLKKFRDNMMLDNLNVDAKDKAAFTAIYNEYIDNQKQIKSQFNPDFDPDKMTDEEAKVKLQQSFELGQKLLDNRKKYAEKMQQVIPCQKVLKLFQSEWKMRDKMNDRKPHDHDNKDSMATPKQNP